LIRKEYFFYYCSSRFLPSYF